MGAVGISPRLLSKRVKAVSSLWYVLKDSKQNNRRMNELSKPAISQPLIDNWLKTYPLKTRENYIASMKRFGEFAGDGMIPALARLIALDRGEAFLVARDYKAWLIERNAASTVNQRLSALRSFVSQCFDAGLVGWQLNVKSERAQQYKDTRGPGEDGFLKMLEYARSIKNRTKSIRDVAILKLLYGQAFRRGALENLNMQDLEADGSVWIHLKGHRDLVKFSLSKDVCEALNAWIETRGDHEGPFFNRVTQSGKILAPRLKGGGIWDIISKIGKKVNLATWPHGLRHAGITTALDRFDGDARKVMRFSGHSNIQTVMRYDDNRKDFGREVAEGVSRKETK